MELRAKALPAAAANGDSAVASVSVGDVTPDVPLLSPASVIHLHESNVGRHGSKAPWVKEFGGPRRRKWGRKQPDGDWRGEHR